MNLLITGASGYVGKNLINFFLKKNLYKVHVLARNKIGIQNKNVNIINYSNFLELNLIEVLKNINIVIHLISKQHKTLSNSKKNYLKYFDINVRITEKLILAINRTNVDKIIFLSTIKVYGEYTNYNNKFSLKSKFRPETNYSKTKLLAEQIIKDKLDINKKYFIVRTPLIYGGGEKGNFSLLKRIISIGFPLPFKKINNSKSLLHIKNLCYFIELLIKKNLSKSKSLIIADETNYSTTEIIRVLIKSMNKKNYLFQFPLFLLTRIISIFIKINPLIKIVYSLEVDSSYSKKLLNYKFKYNFFNYKINE